jgi:hypothetical protein
MFLLKAAKKTQTDRQILCECTSTVITADLEGGPFHGAVTAIASSTRLTAQPVDPSDEQTGQRIGGATLLTGTLACNLSSGCM